MRLTKEAQKVWDKMIKDGLTEEEIFEAIPIWPHEYESEEERITDQEEIKKFIATENAKRTPEQKRRTDELAERFRKEDEENEKR